MFLNKTNFDIDLLIIENIIFKQLCEQNFDKPNFKMFIHPLKNSPFIIFRI